MALPPEAWETLTFAGLPSLRLLRFAFDVARAWQRREEQQPGDLEVAPTESPVSWVIWRPHFNSHFRSTAPDEAVMLAALLEGRPFPDLCESLIVHVGEDQAATRAAGLLRAWVEEGLIASFSH
jgi:hypothetical protein